MLIFVFISDELNEWEKIMTQYYAMLVFPLTY
jgi:hypothetical protein